MNARSLCALATLAGCTGVTLDGGSTGDAPVAVDVSAKCAAAHGPPESPLNARAFTNALAGRWLVCDHDTSSPYLLLAHDGFEFTADGHWYGLKSDTIGGYEHTVNPGTAGTYGIYFDAAATPVPPTDTTPSNAVTLHLIEPALDLAVDFEVDPRRIHARGAVDVWLVRLDEGPNEPIPYTSKEGERCDSTTACRAPLVCDQVRLHGDAGVAGICALR